MADIEIDGLDSIIAKFDELAKCDGLKNGMGKACAAVEAAAKKKAPKDTGALRRSITSKVEADGNEVNGIIYTPIEYAPYVEYGTGLFAEAGNGRKTPWRYQDDKGNWHYSRGQYPQPFMRPALAESRDKIAKIIKEGILND